MIENKMVPQHTWRKKYSVRIMAQWEKMGFMVHDLWLDNHWRLGHSEREIWP